MTEICFVKRAFLILSIFLCQSQVFGGSVPSISVHCGNEKLTWHQASYYCEVRGQHLAIPRSFAELVHIRDFCKKQVWIGAHVYHHMYGGPFIFIDGTHVPKSMWDQLQPNNNDDRGEYCAALITHKLHDYNCEKRFHPACQPIRNKPWW